MTKDLNTGVLSSPVSRSDLLPLHTDILHIAHLNIPRPPCVGLAFMTSTLHDRHPVLESMNQYDILPDLTDSFLDDGAADPRTVQLVNRQTSNSLQAKLSDEKSPTIVTPIITVPPPVEALPQDCRSDEGTTGWDRASI